MRRAPRLVAAALLAAACSGSTEPAANTRTWRMGFSDFPPRYTSGDYTTNLNTWLSRADGAIMHIAPPWAALLAGANAESAVVNTQLPLAAFYRSHGLTLFATIDVTNGLDRSAEAPELVSAGRSITEPAVQLLYRHWLVAFDTLVQPDYLGLAAETNLIRLAAPASLYNAVVTMTNAGAADVLAVRPLQNLYVSVQVEAAWGRLGGPPVYAGVERDFADFPFIDALGLSSYPYLGGFADPADLPDEYYARLPNGRPTPVMVVEGGWASASVPGVASDPAKQARYIHRQQQLLDRAHAIGVFQLNFTDIDTTGFSLPPTSIIPLFISLGLEDANFAPKPALAVWDSGFARAHR